ncbi:MAG: response regulator transcription factor [Acetobacteraceae bacterium]|nr:response regulator transcription factor [Acetobacteraceae bacterium]MBV8523613.1 response regulator transcription factor [Acetobacteraceae bacterium]
MSRILVVDDDADLAEMIAEYLRPEGLAVDLAHDGADPRAATPAGYDLVVLDVMLPNRSGFEILKAIRRTSSVPVILLTARDGETDRVVGLELGADDYVPKPFNPRELAARVRAVLRRAERAAPLAPSPELRVGDVVLNAAARLALRAGRPLDLTSAEFALLECLLRRVGTPVPRDALAAAALGRQHGAGLDRNVDTLVSKLRRKLGADDPIRTVRNIGYLYAAPFDPSS